MQGMGQLDAHAEGHGGDDDLCGAARPVLLDAVPCCRVLARVVRTHVKLGVRQLRVEPECMSESHPPWFTAERDSGRCTTRIDGADPHNAVLAPTQSALSKDASRRASSLVHFRKNETRYDMV